MPTQLCPECKGWAPVRWDAKLRRWRWWPHGPEDKRCKASGVVVAKPLSDESR